MLTVLPEQSFFTREELQCPCCKRLEIDEHAFAAIIRTRFAFGAPLPVISGFRCKEHNRKVGGAENSAHLVGKAFDISTAGIEPYFRMFLLKLSLTMGATGVGVGRNMIHLDFNHDRIAVWGY